MIEKAYDSLFKAINENYNLIYSYGIIEQSTGHFIYELSNNSNRPVFVLCENDVIARKLFENLQNNNLKVDYFPDIELNYQNIEDLDYTNKAFRLKTIINLVNGEKNIIVSSISAVTRKVYSKENFIKNSFEITINSEVDINELSKRLIKLGYKRRNIIQSKGEFAIRGDIIDIFQISDEYPTRLELFDVDVDSIRKFNVNTQMSIKDIENFTIYPIQENYFDIDDIDKIIKEIDKDLQKTNKNFDIEISQKVNAKFEKIKEQLEYQHDIDNIDLIIPYMNDKSGDLFDYISDNYLILLNDYTYINNNFRKSEKFRIEDIQSRIERGELLYKHQNIFYTLSYIENKLKNYKIINISGLLKNIGNLQPDKIIEFKVRQNQSYHGHFDDFIHDLKFSLSNGYTIKIFTPNIDDANSLKIKLSEFDLNSDIIENIKISNKKIKIIIGYLESGFDYFEEKEKFIAYSQIFRKVKKQKSKTVKNKDIINYSDLVHGDLLVHDNYGIGKFVGIKNIEINNIRSDYIELHFKDDAKLFIPTTDMSMVSKFVGNGDKKPALSKLGGTDWKKAKNKAKKAIEAIAEDLVKLYAKRAEIKGFEYSKDTPWQREFEDSFPYQETDAQLRSISEIKEDMESDKVMDRLLCGDVGYGKTEVALRAAFKAVMDGKQVVMLAPTTILVNQHFHTMKSRFEDFPVNIDYLSRFKTPAQKKKVLEDLRKGNIDFIVGTHAILSDNVEFKNLGLLIVDEEQRFGVKHKEKIKKISENIDVLTLSATPIPRTLQMSLSGIRDLSLLDEYPANRLPVNTYVIEYDEEYIREAILREMARNGQVYFVYNEVKTIHKMYEKLKEIVPEASIVISHGQMSTRELENILDDFTNNKYDILLTTTIIETGMDIHNVNTIIIYNADKMGLSQLYQLKGRVGRSDRNSFAYFTYKQGKIMTEIAEKRLKAIKDFSELGCGYKVAMRDLELRGAGNLLGESQSGHIESVGYDLYVRMLKETIDEIKGIEVKNIDRQIKIDLNIDVYIPSEYIKDENEKINIYKKISFIETSQDHYNIIDELTDRFGDIPQPVQNIVDISYIRSLMLSNNIDELIEVDSEVMMRYTELDVFDFEKLKILSQAYKGTMRFSLINSPSIYIPKEKGYMIKLIELFELINNINKGENYEKN
ncbi:transcription-repair coupling factor [Helcococcus ovis]|uniref:transcription-repair coupling factor n=1 Tax=Helcococcus ovis TaxID=72026 RepID=UPI00106F12FB|nr:transcription-repair coupling factor [Helcococcus ovis]TFF68067.1 transcription-repair coupling factor [Helcococcus ovis]WNZ01727.1 transcription-repair coupling factor [Helcococcus ovis]